jgi:hypothetical protein
MSRLRDRAEHSRGRKPRIRSLHFGAGKLHVSCKTVPGAIAVTYKSGVPLRTLVIAAARTRAAIL